MLRMLTRNWWLLVARGALAVIFGVAALMWEPATLGGALARFGAYAFLDGALAAGIALAGRERYDAWHLTFAGGLVGFAAGGAALAWPAPSARDLIALIAGWAAATGLVAIITAARLRREVAGEWLLGLSGVLAVVTGIALAARPDAGAPAPLLPVAWLAVAAGGLLMALGYRVHGFHRQLVRLARGGGVRRAWDSH
jgi:uncharacterized membrane protein HdeD (DUF308 family)